MISKQILSGLVQYYFPINSRYYTYSCILFIILILEAPFRVPRGTVVKCLTCNPGVLGSSRTGSSRFFRGSVLGQDTSEPSLVLVKPRKA